MAQVTMDNPLSPSPQVQLKKIVFDLQECVEDLKHEFQDSGIPITDDNQTLHRFCAKLEFILQAGFKGKISIFGEKKDYWNYFCDCLSSTKGLRDGIKFVKANSELRTSLGRGRAFLRFALMHQRLADTIQQCVCSEKQTNDWYHPRSVWLQPHLTSSIINNLYDLNDLQFDLSPRGYDLDTTWPTFARKTFGSAQSWAPPSRSTSVSSLASIPAMEVPSSPSLSSTRDSDQFQRELSESENDRFTLQIKVESLQEAKEMANKKVNTLEKELADLQKICNENEVRCEKLQNELNLKEAVWTEKESRLKNHVEVAEQSLNELRSQIGASQSSGTQGFDIAELVGKLAVLQKTNAALEIELKTANLELDNKKQVDSGKTKLIELLDKKVEQLSEQNKRMLTQLETAAEDRQKDAAGSKVANTLLEETMNRMQRADAINEQLQKANEALRKMLENVEEKGQRIGTLAKEKLSLYKEENSKLLANVQGLTREVMVLKSGGQVGEAGESAAVTVAMETAQNEIQQLKAKYEELMEECEELKSAKVTTGSQGSETASNQSHVSQLEAQLTRLMTERADTEKSLTAVRSEVKNVVLDKLKVEEELQVIEVKQKEARSRHEELLKVMVQRETLANQLELELSEVRAVLQGSEAGQAGIEEPRQGDRGTVLKVKAILRETRDVQRDLRVADARNISLRKDLETKGKLVEEVSAELMMARLQIAELKTMMSQSEVVVADHASKLEEYESDLESLKNQLTEKETEENTLRDTLGKKEELLCSLSLSLQEQQEHSRESQIQVESKVQNLSSELTSNEKKIVELEDLNQTLEMQMKEMRERFEGVMLQQVTEERHTKDAEDKFKSTKQNLKKVDKENKKLLIERDHLRKEAEKLRQTVSTLQMDTESLEVQLQTQDQSVSDSVEEKLSTLQTALVKEREARQQMDVTVAHLRKRHQENEVLVNMMQEKKETVLKEYETNLGSKQSEMSDLQNKISALQNERERLQENQGEVESDRDRLNQELGLIKSDLEKVVGELKESEASVREVRNELDTVRLGKLNLEAAKEIIVTEIGNLKATLEEKEMELESVKKSRANSSQELENYETVIKSLEGDKGAIQCELESVQQELRETKERLKTLEDANHDLDTRLSIAAEANNSATESLASQQQELQNTIQYMEEEAMNKMDETTSLRQKLQEAEKELELVRGKLVQSNQYHQEANEHASLKQKLHEVEAELTSTQQTLMSAQAEMALQEAKFLGVRECLDQEVSALRFQLSSEQMQHEESLRGFDTDGSSMSDLVTKITVQESLIESMEQELEQLKRDRLVEKSRMWTELEELRQSLGNRDEECKLLNKELKRTSMLLDEERNLVLKFKNEMVDERTSHSEEMKKNLEETELLRNDTVVLKEQLIKLIKDKDVLWQKTDKLEYLQKLTLSGSWMEDNNVRSCLGCNAEFSFMLRKHHCRLCGRIFCYGCSNHWVMTPHSSKKERICDDCASMHSFVESDRSTETERTSDEEGSELEDPGPSRQGTRCTPEGGVSAPYEDRPPVTFTADDDDLEESNVEEVPTKGSVSPAVDVAEATPKQLEDTVAMPTKSTEPEATSSDVVQETSSEKPPRKKRVSQAEDEPDDDVYDVITEQEVVQSMHDSLIEADSSVTCCPLLTVDQIARDQPLAADRDVWVRASRVYAVPIFIEAPGVVLCWDFSTEPKGIHFSVTYRSGPLTSSDSAEVLIPSCRCNSHKQAVQGELIARKPGVYTLLFDNSTSRITSKKLIYHLHVKKPEAAD